MDRQRFSGAGPLRAFRDRYVAAFGGLSYDLAPGAVGVHPEHLDLAPDLPGRSVLVSGDGVRLGPSLRPVFQVVPLTGLMRNAWDLAQGGALVFSTFDLEDPMAGRLVGSLSPGEVVYLNAAVERLPEAVVRRPWRQTGTAA